MVRLADYLASFDWRDFQAAYHPHGRQPLHPRLIVGLVVYGFSQSVHSLRGLEKLAARDVGAMYLCGGVRPDHSTIGKFIVRHAGLLTHHLFEQTLADIVAHFGLRFEELAGDGTVVEAWGSHYRALEKEALEEERLRTEKKLAMEPEDKVMQAKAAALAAAGQELNRRLEKKEAVGKTRTKTKIHPEEPEAVYQPLKNKTYRFSYKPLLLASAQRFIVSHSVQPSQEAQGMLEMLRGFESGLGRNLKHLMLDASFLTQDLLEFGLVREWDLLIPSGRAGREEWERQPRQGVKDLKTSFTYDQDSDGYHCPAGQTLYLESEHADHQGRRVRSYRCRDAAHCPRKEKCTDSARGRTIKRYEFDDLKEAMRKVLTQPAARDRYRRRAGMVEPVFGSLRQEQGLSRFQRQGLTKVRLEFALHAVAYNLGRAFRLLGMVRGRLKNPSTSIETCFYMFFRMSFRIQGNMTPF